MILKKLSLRKSAPGKATAAAAGKIFCILLYQNLTINTANYYFLEKFNLCFHVSLFDIILNMLNLNFQNVATDFVPRVISFLGKLAK